MAKTKDNYDPTIAKRQAIVSQSNQKIVMYKKDTEILLLSCDDDWVVSQSALDLYFRDGGRDYGDYDRLDLSLPVSITPRLMIEG